MFKGVGMSKYFVSGLLTGICYLALQSSVLSAEQNEPEELGPIVVTASGNEQSLEEVTRSVTVVDSQQIERSIPDSVSEALRDVPGVKIVDSSVPGMKRISIRGEESSRNVVLVDGQSISDQTSYGAVLLVAPSDIERVEVVKGPGSVLYGSKAIGGVVNIITKKGANRPLEIEVGTSFDSSTNGLNGYSSAAGTIDKWDYRLSISKSKHGDRETPSGTLEESGFGNQSTTAYVRYNGDQHKLSLKAERYELESDVYSSDRTSFDMKLPKRDRSKIGFFYDFANVNDAISNIHLDGYFQQIDRLAYLDYAFGPISRSNKTDSEFRTSGLNGTVDLTLLANNLTTIGFQTIQEVLDKDGMSTGTTFGKPFHNEQSNEATLTTLSAFLQNEWDITKDLTLSAGGRYYFVKSENEGTAGERDENDQAFIGSIGVNYTGLDNLSLRAHLSQGYVYPTLLQSTIGTNFTPAGALYGNLDLTPETSVTAEVGARYDDGAFTLDVGAFYTDAENYIDSVSCTSAVYGSVCTPKSYIYDNVDSAKTWGLELAASYKFEELSLSPYASVTVMRRQFTEGSDSTFETNTPLFSGRFGVTKDWSFNNGVEAHGDIYSRFASEHREDGKREPGFATLNLAGGLSYNFDDESKLKVNAAIENIFDLDYKPSLDELTAASRAYKLSASITF